MKVPSSRRSATVAVGDVAESVEVAADAAVPAWQPVADEAGDICTPTVAASAKTDVALRK